MTILAKGSTGGDFEAPPVGVHPALCIDVIDLGEVETPFTDERTGEKKIQHQIQIVWQLLVEDDSGNEITRKDGKPFRISKFYNLSLNEQANLRKNLESWRGLRFKDSEVEDGFDVEKLIGHQCQLALMTYEKKGGGERTVVDNVLPKHKRDPKIEQQADYQREKDRPGGRDTRSPKSEIEEEYEARKEASAPDLPDFGDDDEDDPLPF